MENDINELLNKRRLLQLEAQKEIEKNKKIQKEILNNKIEESKQKTEKTIKEQNAIIVDSLENMFLSNNK